MGDRGRELCMVRRWRNLLPGLLGVVALLCAEAARATEFIGYSCYLWEGPAYGQIRLSEVQADLEKQEARFTEKDNQSPLEAGPPKEWLHLRVLAGRLDAAYLKGDRDGVLQTLQELGRIDRAMEEADSGSRLNFAESIRRGVPLILRRAYLYSADIGLDQISLDTFLSFVPDTERDFEGAVAAVQVQMGRYAVQAAGRNRYIFPRGFD